MKKFWIAFLICWLLFIHFNALFSIEPKPQAGHSYTRRVGFPFPVLLESVRHTASGPVVSTIMDRRPWGLWVNMGVWLCLSYGFAHWIQRNSSAWWRGASRHEPYA